MPDAPESTSQPRIRPARTAHGAELADDDLDLQLDERPLIQPVSALLRELEEDPCREGLLETPKRVARSLRFLTAGYRMDLADVVNDAVFGEEYSQMVAVTDIEFYSLCEHHLLPFYGQAHVAYIPKGCILGLSKLPRLVDMFARRLQVQERLTEQIASAVEEAIHPLGTAVVLEGLHLCMMMRGVQKQNSRAVTSAVRGAFASDARTRAEFMALIRRDR